jgi:hypothetical protein
MYCVRNIEELVLFPCKEYLEWNRTVFPMSRPQWIPDFFVAVHYGLRNTTYWWPKDLALGRPMKGRQDYDLPSKTLDPREGRGCRGTSPTRPLWPLHQ